MVGELDDSGTDLSHCWLCDFRPIKHCDSVADYGLPYEEGPFLTLPFPDTQLQLQARLHHLPALIMNALPWPALFLSCMAPTVFPTVRGSGSRECPQLEHAWPLFNIHLSFAVVFDDILCCYIEHSAQVD